MTYKKHTNCPNVWQKDNITVGLFSEFFQGNIQLCRNQANQMGWKMNEHSAAALHYMMSFH